MTFRSQDERRLLEAFVAYMIAKSPGELAWLKLAFDTDKLVTEFLKSREVR